MDFNQLAPLAGVLGAIVGGLIGGTFGLFGHRMNLGFQYKKELRERLVDFFFEVDRASDAIFRYYGCRCEGQQVVDWWDDQRDEFIGEVLRKYHHVVFLAGSPLEKRVTALKLSVFSYMSAAQLGRLDESHDVYVSSVQDRQRTYFHAREDFMDYMRDQRPGRFWRRAVAWRIPRRRNAPQ